MAINKVTVSFELSMETIELMSKISEKISTGDPDEILHYALEKVDRIQENHKHERSTLVLAPHVDRNKIELMEKPELPGDAIIINLPRSSYNQIQFMSDLFDKTK